MSNTLPGLIAQQNDAFPVECAEKGGDVAIYDPDRGLKSIVAHDAIIKHYARDWRKTSDPFAREQLETAIDKKIDEQVAYIVYRDSVVVPSRKLPGAGRGKKPQRVSEVQPSELPAADPGKVVTTRWRKRFFAKRGEPDPEMIALAKSDAKHRAIRICEQQGDPVRGTQGTGDNEWFTPPEYVELARRVLGKIDLDPATSIEAQKIIQAERFYTKTDDGLKQEWRGNVWLNPPYSQPLIAEFVHKLGDEWRAGHVTACIALTNNYTDTNWFDEVAANMSAVCFVHRRVKFCRGSKIAAPTQGQAFSYFGDHVQLFEDLFCTIGNCFRLSRAYESAR